MVYREKKAKKVFPIGEFTKSIIKCIMKIIGLSKMIDDKNAIVTFVMRCL